MLRKIASGLFPLHALSSRLETRSARGFSPAWTTLSCVGLPKLENSFVPRMQSCTGKASAEPLSPWPQVRQEHPLNLSILLSGGKETNQDSPSSGERSGKSPTCKSGTCPRIVVYRSALRSGPGPSSLERDVREGENPVDPGACCPTRRCPRVGLLGSAALIGW